MAENNLAGQALGKISDPLLRWYRANRRRLPFREDPTPYRVLVSEIMLQQTRVETVLPYFERFVAELPDIQALAACDESRLHKLWQGLGYYSRARNLQKAARMILREHDGEIPRDYPQLLALPGVGPYTAGAVASIAFGLPQVAVDGNVLRVFSRLLCSEADISADATRRMLAGQVEKQMPHSCPGDYNQALMELGAMVCLPKAPRCSACPLQKSCKGFLAGRAEALPRKMAKPAKMEIPLCVLPVRRGAGWVIRQRPAKGLLAGMWEPPNFEGRLSKKDAQAQLDTLLPGVVLGRALPGATHVFTHRIWRMTGWAGWMEADAPLPPGFECADAAALGENYAIPAAFRSFFPSAGWPAI